jgi:hypothetical protein
MENENQKKKIDSDFYYYLSYRETDDKEKLKRLEQWIVEACIDYAVYYNGLIQRVDKFLTVFEELHREKKGYMYLTKRYTKEQVEQVLTDENLGIPLSQYTNGKLSGYYYYNEAKKDKLFFKAALDIREAKDNLIRLIKEIKEKAATEPQPSNGNCPRLRTKRPGLNKEQLGDLYERLIEGGYIKKETEKKLFVWLFGGDIEPQPFTPIKWEKNKTLLVYLIDCICYDPTVSFNYWKNAEMIFEVKHMAQTKQNYLETKNTHGKPRGHNEIDSIISNIRGV